MKEIRKLIACNWKTLVGFELIYKLASAIIFVPLIWGLFDLIMRARGYYYLTLENIGSFLLNPFTILALLLVFVVATVGAMIDISAVIFILDQSARENKVHLQQVVKFSVKNAFRAWKPKNFMLVIVVLLFMPLANIGMASGLLSTISIPEFIMNHIEKNAALSVLFALAMLVITILMMRWMYAFHYFTLEGCSFKEARRKSGSLIKKRRFRDFLSMLLTQLVFVVTYILFVCISIIIASFVGKIFSGAFILKWFGTTAIWMIIIFSFCIFAGLSIPISYGCISVLYYRHKETAGEYIIHSAAPEYNVSENRMRFIHFCNVILGCVVVVLGLTLGFFLCSGKLNPNIEYVRTMEVTAHRGASAFYPENTMAAFEGAKEMGADWIELDVQQSKDGQIIVMHDTNFKRTTGVDANTWELTYEEISKLDAGSFFDSAFAGEKIPLLSQVVAFAEENNIKLNIELKPTGHETDFEKCVVDVVKAAGIEENCVITSQVYEVLENVKEYDSAITTVYVMSLAYGDINKLEAADHFSVEATNATPSLISSVHREGKQLYVWTVNTKESITKMAELNVDNIITDDIELARKCIYESRYSNLLVEYIKLFE
ncbi:MAG: glycerophosphodiester phosphodiesterase [Clostridium sp.]|nr:glycerophosphodiester phosphodiesterase [Clostridium sp.]MCM1170534.1 glycerophosphodiester phosphodiesterase [Clostridium sp.]MCM1207923.1 glycerophosphodiester phosphodiesterase [Ruminococcus sp.]